MLRGIGPSTGTCAGPSRACQTAAGNSGQTGSGTTNLQGQTTFTYTGTQFGTDSVQASVTTTNGTFTSNTAKVIWGRSLPGDQVRCPCQSASPSYPNGPFNIRTGNL